MELVKCFEELIRQMVNPSLMTDIEFGEVVGVGPLKIKLNDIITLEESNLIMTNAVKDHEVDVTVAWNTEETDVEAQQGHSHKFTDTTNAFGATLLTQTQNTKIENSNHIHEIKNKKKIIIHNALKKGEKVLLIKGLGGQKYVVLDRLTDYECEGEWNE